MKFNSCIKHPFSRTHITEECHKDVRPCQYCQNTNHHFLLCSKRAASKAKDLKLNGVDTNVRSLTAVESSPPTIFDESAGSMKWNDKNVSKSPPSNHNVLAPSKEDSHGVECKTGYQRRFCPVEFS